MTLEEKAKDYANKWLWSVKDLEIEHKTDPKPEYIRIEEAYLAGAKENGTVWHDLGENPDDLPENKRKVWCDYDDGCGKGFYDEDDSRWCIEGHLYCSSINAWCELPTFDKEIKE